MEEESSVIDDETFGRQCTIDYDASDMIGRGAFGTVYRATIKDPDGLGEQDNVAVKVITLETKSELLRPENWRRFRTNLKRLPNLIHEHVLAYHSVTITNGSTTLMGAVSVELIMDFCEGGNLANFLQKLRHEKILLDLATALRYAAEITEGLLYLHQNSIIHGDLKPGNVLIKQYGTGQHMQKMIVADLENFTPKLPDIISPQHTTEIIDHFTIRFASPELLRIWCGISSEEVYTPKTDIWSLGQTMLDLAGCVIGQYQKWLENGGHKIEVESLSRHAFIFNMAQGNYVPFVCELIPVQFATNIRECLRANATERISTDMLLKNLKTELACAQSSKFIDTPPSSPSELQEVKQAKDVSAASFQPSFDSPTVADQGQDTSQPSYHPAKIVTTSELLQTKQLSAPNVEVAGTPPISADQPRDALPAETVHATNFKLKCTSPESVTYVVELERTETTRISGKDYALPLYGPLAEQIFTFSGFDNLTKLDKLPLRAELTRRLSHHMDSVSEMEELRRLVQPLVDAFQTNYGRTSVQEYYGIDYTRQSEIPSSCYILTELCEGVPLDEFLRKEIPHDYLIIKLMKHILEGTKFLHNHQIIHRDIKAANVTVSRDRKTVKITGLTMAVHLASAPRGALETAAGTVPFISPEMAELSVAAPNHASRIDCATDVWSVGCLMIQILQKGQPPNFVKGPDDPVIKPTAILTFQDANHYFKGNYRPQYPNARTCGHDCIGTECRLVTNEIVQLLTSCLDFDPQKRPSASDLLQLPYFYPFYMPLRKKTAQQRLVVETYELESADQAVEEYYRLKPTLFAQPGITVTEQPGASQQQLQRLREKIVLPEILRGDIPPGRVYIIYPDPHHPKCNRQDMLNKQKVYQLLLNEIPKETEHVFRHVAVPPMSENPLELLVFTESELNYMPLLVELEALTHHSHYVGHFTEQILQGLTVLHQHGIIHKDVRCANVLAKRTVKDGVIRFLLKIAHFDKASYHGWDSALGSFIDYPEGSSRHASIEMQKLLSFKPEIEPDPVGKATDVFSLGCTVIEMLTKKKPRWKIVNNGGNTTTSTNAKEYTFLKEDTDLRTFLDHLKNLLDYEAVPLTDDDDDDDKIFANCPDKKDAKEFVESCFTMPSKNRPTCQRLRLHPFVSQ